MYFNPEFAVEYNEPQRQGDTEEHREYILM